MFATVLNSRELIYLFINFTIVLLNDIVSCTRFVHVLMSFYIIEIFCFMFHHSYDIYTFKARYHSLSLFYIVP